MIQKEIESLGFDFIRLDYEGKLFRGHNLVLVARTNNEFVIITADPSKNEEYCRTNNDPNYFKGIINTKEELKIKCRLRNSRN